MKQTFFRIPIYEIDIFLYQVEGKEDANAAERILKRFKLDEYISEIKDAVSRGACDGGETFRDLRNRRIILMFYPFENEKEKITVYEHEKRHVEDRILKYFGIDDIESAALLAGWLGNRFREFEKL